MGTGEQAWEAAVRYDEFRRSCYTKTLDSIALLRGEGIIPGAITEIFLCAVGLEQANEAMTWTDRRFDWVKKVEEFHPYINRFEVSVYSSGQLCALTLGRPSKGPDNVTIHFLERRKHENPLAGSVAMIVADVADNYAKVLGKEFVKLKNPDPIALARYEKIGFSLAERVSRNTYYKRKVK